MRKIAKEENVSFNSVSNIIKKFGERNTLDDLPKSGRKKGAHNQELDKKIKTIFKNKPGISVRDAAKKANTTIGMIQRCKKRLNLKTYKKQKQPKRDATQSKKAYTRARKLYDILRAQKEQCIIMDDETYCKYDFKTLPGPQYYTVKKGQTVSKQTKAIFTEKFGKKMMVWQAICQCGMKSKPFFTNKNMNADLYRTECLQKRVLPMVRLHNVPVMFWPDLATCHYATDCLEWYNSNNVQFVEKDTNPPNSPEVRPIERYWGIIKRHLQTKVKAATSPEDFKKKWIRAADSQSEDTVQNLMKRLRPKLRNFYVDKK